MARYLCSHCGAEWYSSDDQRSYYFSSTSWPAGSYVSAAEIIEAGEDILTCPKDALKTDTHYPEDSFTPSGVPMATGDDRYTSGDETDPKRSDVTPTYPPLSEQHEDIP